MSLPRFDPITLPPGIAAWRAEVRDFIGGEMAAVPGGIPAERRANAWSVFDAGFSRRLGRRGWIGLTWPRRYGGAERSALERYVLLEELLAAGAPVGAHWIADRQSGPALLRYGSEAQRQRLLPAIARGECFFCIGMSEPGAGSDLAAVRTRAERRGDGWVVTGQKLWTTHAHQAQMMIALVRTAPEGARRHEGLSQLLIDMRSPGLSVRPIVDLAGEVHFNEVFFDEVPVPADMLLGTEGQGWAQCTSELSLERSGPERYLSSHALFDEWLRHVGTSEAAGAAVGEATRMAIGQISAELWTLRQMSLSVAGRLAAGEDPTLEAAIVKDLGNSFEQALPRRVQALLDSSVTLEDEAPLARVLVLLLQTSPSFSLRGGTREILRGIIAKGLGLR
ncbi:acyl-CoA dehydrogenase family protein [Aquabacterium sp.]|uniref:acyl-CoA dehydrogenase family protein n=1 Tax=Aquabacterium sp. TaxID=1872578 RepID=UPI002B53F74F|nr:acyl-CoA dehydrogenase family protein [Aquabacterium sp.]HSW06037.1 acyl-CoA dehydrogenase family protein [Aquabacterium sp.]